ncbi:MAG: hypothetical protein EOO62_29305, partial [Hymenobacter sp.]
MLFCSPALAQTPTIEFAAGMGNPTTSGPSVANQVITFQANADNPTGNTFTTFTPTTQATFSLSNQQYTLPTTRIATGMGVSFGAGSNGSGTQANALALFPLLQTIGSPTDALYSAVASTVGTGINVALNSATEVYMSAEPLPATVPANARYQYADLTITFNQPIANPVLDFSGLGSTSSTSDATGTFPTGIGFTTELDLL